MREKEPMEIIAFRVPRRVKERFVKLAEKEMRTQSNMGRVLFESALNERECSAAIREAFGGEQER